MAITRTNKDYRPSGLWYDYGKYDSMVNWDEPPRSQSHLMEELQRKDSVIRLQNDEISFLREQLNNTKKKEGIDNIIGYFYKKR